MLFIQTELVSHSIAAQTRISEPNKLGKRTARWKQR